MSLFQQSVLVQYLTLQDEELIDKRYKKFIKYFHNATRQQNIRDSKEEQLQSIFLTALFVDVFDYTPNPEPNFDLTTEHKNEKGAKKADGAILKDDQAIAVIELKGTKTKNLEKIRQQAFDYKANHSACVYVITSNFEKLRFYIDNAVEHLEFDLFTLTLEEFRLLNLCVSQHNILTDLPKTIKEESLRQEKAITDNLYKDYSVFKRELFRSLVKLNIKNEIFRNELNNQDDEQAKKNIKLTLFKKSQKLIDRLLFIFFAEDRNLLSPNSTLKILQIWNNLNELDAEMPLYDRFKQYFNYLDTGRVGTDKQAEIYAYNGGLFKPDPILDSLIINDKLLYAHTHKLSEYDFASQVDVNILGHIFENSLNEIENVNAEIEGVAFDKQKTKRKKDGVFYTPKYITKYIVDNTVGKLCSEKQAEYGIIEEEYLKGKKGRPKAKIEALFNNVESYREWLLTITICDPACGSGAFLNQALDFLIKEHHYLDGLISSLTGSPMVLSNIETTILENNIYGVDINEESVEIAKLSLWLRTARPRRKLNDLSRNINCGNSINNNKSLSGGKAFNWESKFLEVFKNGGFDIVIGNPPYGAYLNEREKIFYANSFLTFQGNHEIYFFFIELVNSLLKKGGYVGYITPDTWISIPQAQKLRAHVLSNYGLKKIVAFDYPVFSDASVNALIFTAEKSLKNKECKVLFADDVEKKLTIASSKVNTCKIQRWFESEDQQFQIWQNELDIKIIKKIKKKSVSAVEYLDVCQGIVPYSTENLTKDEVKQRIYHSDLCQDDTWNKWVQGRSINRFSIDTSKAEFLNYGDWLHRPRKPKYFLGERILIQEITSGKPPRINAAIYHDTLYHDPGIISCLNISELSSKYLLAVINSKLISWYSVKTSPKGKRKTFPKVLIGDIRRIPIIHPKPNIQDSIKILVNNMVSTSNDAVNVSNAFLKFLSSSLQIEIFSKKILNWSNLTFYEFILEINKSIKKTGSEKLSKSDEMEWMEVFETKKIVAQNLKAQIDKTDMEIDALVYELYGLTKEEIAIVEQTQ